MLLIPGNGCTARNGVIGGSGSIVFDGWFWQKRGKSFLLRVPEKKSSKRLLLEIFATVVDVLAELCLNKNWERLR